jgi:hypothetical protein
MNSLPLLLYLKLKSIGLLEGLGGDAVIVFMWLQLKH